ncbi:MAG: transposon-encoded TnpW family protein [Clostridiales bacterium]|nr:transposon-encoded TnpW family protein [Clostridiales bacterium]
MQTQPVKEATDKYEPGGNFKTVIGKTTYEVSVFFNKASKVSLEDKIKRLIRQDVKNGDF